MAHYVIGVDYGSLSARAVLFDVKDGSALAEGEFPYPHGIMDSRLPGGPALPLGWALQHPQDYLDALSHLIPALIRDSGVANEQVIALGIDMTAASVLPVEAQGQPLCLLPRWRQEPHAYVKMWKHQSAQAEADRMTALARQRGDGWLHSYGGIISSTWLHPKLLETYQQAPELLSAAAHYLEGADWLVWLLTGRLCRNGCAAGYKALYDGQAYPANDYFMDIDPGYAAQVARLCGGPVLPTGSMAGSLTPSWAKRLGLRPDTIIATGMVDAHVGMVASGITGPGVMHSILGTSGCHMMLGKDLHRVPGICGVVWGGILPSFHGYEAGQVSFGDHLAWLVDELLPERYQQEAQARGMDAHGLLSHMAAPMLPGQTGLLALDWWNGNRSILVDSDLSGLLVGLSLKTRPEDIYRALLEALALSARLIVDNFRQHGIPVESLSASGGISQKNPLAMQIYADAIGLPLTVPLASQGAALGSAILAAAAAGQARGGYEDPLTAIRHMAPREARSYQPNPRHREAYQALYQEYRQLHDYFGRGDNDVMKRLLRLKAAQSFDNG